MLDGDLLKRLTDKIFHVNTPIYQKFGQPLMLIYRKYCRFTENIDLPTIWIPENTDVSKIELPKIRLLEMAYV